MPVIKSAKKKLRQDKKRQEKNKVVKDFLKSEIKAFRTSPTEKKLQAVYKAADKAVKKGIVHKNKAARIKSSLATSMKKEEKHVKPVKAKTLVKKPSVKAKKKS